MSIFFSFTICNFVKIYMKILYYLAFWLVIFNIMYKLKLMAKN